MMQHAATLLPASLSVRQGLTGKPWMLSIKAWGWNRFKALQLPGLSCGPWPATATSIDLKASTILHTSHIPAKVLANDPASQRHQSTDDLEGFGGNSQVMGWNSPQHAESAFLWFDLINDFSCKMHGAVALESPRPNCPGSTGTFKKKSVPQAWQKSCNGKHAESEIQRNPGWFLRIPSA